MSQENVDFVRAAIELVNRGEFDEVLQATHADVV